MSLPLYKSKAFVICHLLLFPNPKNDFWCSKQECGMSLRSSTQSLFYMVRINKHQILSCTLSGKILNHVVHKSAIVIESKILMSLMQ
jgi:hypothetical protein